MREKSRRIALAGMMVALGTIAMLLGVLPLQTFTAPALAGLTLLPILYEYGGRWTLAAWAAIALLALMLSADKESALLFLFLGYYPVLKASLDRLRAKPVRVLLKLLVFNAAAGAMLFSAVKLFGLTAILEEYGAMSKAMLFTFIVLANITMLVYDLLLKRMLRMYAIRIRPKVIGKTNDGKGTYHALYQDAGHRK